MLHTGKTMAGRAFTVQFMPARADLTKVANDNARAAGITRAFNNQAAIDMLQPGDVLVCTSFHPHTSRRFSTTRTSCTSTTSGRG
jgi:regulator of RNase E activity RraA